MMLSSATGRVAPTATRLRVSSKPRAVTVARVIPSAGSSLRSQSINLVQRERVRCKAAKVVTSASSQPVVIFTERDLKSPPNPVVRSTLSFVSSIFLPAALIGALWYGYTYPDLGVLANSYDGAKWATVAIFFLSGLSLRTQEIAQAVRSFPAALYGMASTLALAPLAAIPILSLPGTELPRALAVGLAVMCCVPTTLSTGVVLTGSVGGNVAVALALVLLTNIAGVFTIPYAVKYVLGESASKAAAAIRPETMISPLAETILLPLLVGAAIRIIIPGVRALVDANRGFVRFLSSSLLIATPWMQVSSSKAALSSLGLPALLNVAKWAAAVHCALLAGNMVLTAILGVGGRGKNAKHTRRAVVLTSSQKTLPVAVAVLAVLGAGGTAKAPNVFGSPGVMVISCIAFHLLQIAIDSALVSVWKAQDGAQ